MTGSQAVAQRADRRRPRLSLAAAHPDVPALASLVLCFAIFAVFAKGFVSVDNVRSIVISATVVACMGIGENLVILAGEIDVSLGSVLALGGFAAGPVAVATDNLWLTLLVALGVCCAAGLANGLIVAFTKVPSIVATLGTLYAYQGVALLLSGSQDIVSVPPQPSVLGAGSVLGFPAPALVVAGVFAAVTLWRHNTNLGRDLIAVGANRRAAQTMGVRVRTVIIVAFTLAGLVTGLATVLYLGEVGGMQTSVVDTNTVLQVIAACAIGGTSIQGGRGTDLAPVIGALLIGLITDGVVILGVAGVWFSFVYGAFILLAVARDRFWVARKRSQ